MTRHIKVPYHALEQWIRRSPPTIGGAEKADVRRAWFRGDAVVDHQFVADEVRHDPESEMVMLRNGQSIVTVIHEKTAVQRADIEVGA